MLDVEVGLSNATIEQQRSALAVMQHIADNLLYQLDNDYAAAEDKTARLAASNIKAAILASLQEQARKVEQRRGHASGLQRAMEILEPLIEVPVELNEQLEDAEKAQDGDRLRVPQGW